MGAGGELKTGSSIHLNIKCVFIEVHRQPQFTYQAGMVAYSSLTPSIAISAPQRHHALHSGLL